MQSQHYLPQVYLRQWCVDHQLMRYRWIAAASKLVGDRKSPRSIAAEFDLYTLPEGGKANGYTGDDLELELSRQVDQRIPGICAGAAQAIGGHVSDEALERDIVWLMKTFVARSPVTLAQQEAAVVDTMAKHRGMIERMLERVQSDELRAAILGFQDPRMPKVAAALVSRWRCQPTSCARKAGLRGMFTWFVTLT